MSKFGQLKIASQIFIETNCGKTTDIIFQFGVLNSKQKKFLKDPSEYGAISVRTEYDGVSLRGRGFIYISPSHGPLSYDTSAIAKDAWSVDGGRLLYLALLHELGHVFGLQHMGSYGDLMSQGFVESILTNSKGSSVPDKLNFFSLRKKGRLICPSAVQLSRWQNFFDARISDKCFQFDFIHDSKNELFGKTLLQVSVADSVDGSLMKIQSIELTMDRFFPSFTSLIWLSRQQEVFSKDDLITIINSGMPGISHLTIGKQGAFYSSDKKLKKSVAVRFEQGRETFFIDGIIDGAIAPIL